MIFDFKTFLVCSQNHVILKTHLFLLFLKHAFIYNRSTLKTLQFKTQDIWNYILYCIFNFSENLKFKKLTILKNPARKCLRKSFLTFLLKTFSSPIVLYNKGQHSSNIKKAMGKCLRKQFFGVSYLKKKMWYDIL